MGYVTPEEEAINENAELHEQIDKLGTFILEHVQGEPSQSEGAIDTAIRVIAATQRALGAAHELLRAHGISVPEMV